MTIAVKNLFLHDKTNLVLEFRQPSFPWVITGLIGALSLHGATWFLTRALVPGAADALTETQRQVGLGLFWMIGTLALWSLNIPKSRRHAFFITVMCTAFVGLLGSVVAFVQMLVKHDVPVSVPNMIPFATFSLLMILAQLILAAPSAFVLQQIVLKRRPKV